MTTYSMGVSVVLEYAKMKAKADSYSVVVPEHLWEGVLWFHGLSLSSLFKMAKGNQTHTQCLNDERKKLRVLLENDLPDLMADPRRSRQKLDAGKSSGDPKQKSSETANLFSKTKKLAATERSLPADVSHLARILRQHAPFLQQTPDRPSESASVLSQWGRKLSITHIPPISNRKEDIRRLGRVLIQKRKNCVILAGGPGVGKTSVVYGLARNIASPKCPPVFQGKEIVDISLEQLLAGVPDAEGFKTQLEAILKAGEADDNIILFIDDFGACLKDAALQSAARTALTAGLATGNARLILCLAVLDDDPGPIDDAVFQKFFEILWIEEPSRNETMEIIGAVKRELEAHHHLTISPAAVEAAVDLSTRFLPTQRLPAKAIRLIDQAAACRSLDTFTISASTEGTVSLDVADSPAAVERSDIVQAVAQSVPIPVELIAADDRRRLSVLEPYLTQRIAGQHRVMKAIAHSFQHAYDRSGRLDPLLLLAGPVDEPKTETARALSEFLFGDPGRVISIELPVADLAAPRLFAASLRRCMASVLLFQHIEHAGADDFKRLLQLLETGRMRDKSGRYASIAEALMVFTTDFHRHQLKEDLKEPLFRKFIGSMDHIVDFGASGDASGKPTGEILYTAMPSSPNVNAALLVLDLVQSTHLVRQSGDTEFSNLIGKIYTIFQNGGTASDLMFLKCTGDGFLGVYQTVDSAFSIADAFLNKQALPDISFRMALHWGKVKSGPHGDPLGVEVHQVFRMESLKEENRDAPARGASSLPAKNRLIISKEALTQLTAQQRTLFRPAGKFHMKGFSKPIDVWIATAADR